MTFRTRVRSAAGRALPALFLPLLLSAPSAGLAAQEVLRRGASNDQLIDEPLRAAVKRGLDWLQQNQNRDGYWAELVGYKLNTDYETLEPNPLPHVGVTSLALMSFLAGGHLPNRGEYGTCVRAGLDFVLTCSQDDGQITANGTRMYSHAFATLFLAEIYGMVDEPEVKRRLQRAVDLIVDSQNAEGGWRYRPFARESDMSITVCQVLAPALSAPGNKAADVPQSGVLQFPQGVFTLLVLGGQAHPGALEGGVLLPVIVGVESDQGPELVFGDLC